MSLCISNDLSKSLDIQKDNTVGLKLNDQSTGYTEGKRRRGRQKLRWEDTVKGGIGMNHFKTYRPNVCSKGSVVKTKNRVNNYSGLSEENENEMPLEAYNNIIYLVHTRTRNTHLF